MNHEELTAELAAIVAAWWGQAFEELRHLEC